MKPLQGAESWHEAVSRFGVGGFGFWVLVSVQLQILGSLGISHMFPYWVKEIIFGNVFSSV